ncbi:MAG: hypothetical protein ACI96G_001071 [Flavobacterium sp.]|jgi:hypothetical protein
MKTLNKKFLLVVLAILSLSSCSEDFLVKKPTEFVDYASATSTTENLYSLLNGIHRSLYIRYEGQNETGIAGCMQQVDIAGEDIVYPISNGWFLQVYNWTGLSDENSQDVAFPYRTFYRINRNANTILESVDLATGLDADRKIIKGQALLYRAFAHFQLVQLYGQRYNATAKPNTQLGIPIVLKVSNDQLPRSTVEEVYTQINKDIDDALVLLVGYTKPNNSHLDLRVAQGLKARVALVQQNWPVASANAILARSGKSLMTNAAYASGFNSYTNPEWMWGSFVNELQSESFANFGAYMSRNFSSTVIRSCPKAIFNKLWDQFPATDVRTTIFSKSGNHPNITLVSTARKFPYTSQKFLAVSTGDSRCDIPYMRIAEMYLIEAEAKAWMGDATASQALFTLISNRDPAYVKSTATGQTLVNAIYLQRRLELWGEGFRFYDLKRTNSALNRVGPTTVPATTSNHISSVALEFNIPAGDKRWQWLFPRAEINANPAIVQNPN